MATTNAIEVAEDALVALLLGDATLAALSQGAGKPQLGEPTDPPREIVFVYEGASSEQRQLTTGATRGTRWDVTTLRLAVAVAKGDTWVATRDRLRTLAVLVEDLIRNTPKLGVPAEVYDTQIVRVERSSALLGDSFRGAIKILTLEVRAVLA